MKAESPDKKSGSSDVLEVFDAFHRDVRIQLDRLLSLVGELQMEAPPDEKVKEEVRDVIAFFTGPVRDHNYDEERSVFPSLRSSDDSQVRQAAGDLCEDHAWIELCWLDMEPALAMVANGSAARHLPALRSTVQAFAGVLRDHMDLEESLLYPQLRGRLRVAAVR